MREVVETVTVTHITVTTPSKSNSRQLTNDADSVYLEEQILAFYDLYDPHPSIIQ